LTQTIETLRTIRLNLYQQRIVKDIGYKLESNYEATLELDSHANTCVLGRDALIIFDYNQPVSIVGYDESLGRKTYQTVSGVVAYDDPQTGRMLHLITNQAIHIPHPDHHLLCPMQCRVNDMTVNDLPKFLSTMTLPLTFLTFWTLTVPHSISTLSVLRDGWWNLDVSTLGLKFLCYLLTWHAHARATLRMPCMSWDIYD
jgi:hypothetical protein